MDADTLLATNPSIPPAIPDHATKIKGLPNDPAVNASVPVK